MTCTQVFYHVWYPKGQTRNKFSGNAMWLSLRKNLDERRELKNRVFKVFLDDLPEYVKEEIQCHADVDMHDDYVRITAFALRQFLDYNPHRYFDAGYEAEYKTQRTQNQAEFEALFEQ